MNIILWAFLLSMTPIGELRAGLPVALAGGLNPIVAFIVCYVANLLVFPVVLLFLEFIHHHFLHLPGYRNIFDLFMERTRKRAHRMIEKYGIFGLALFVAIPIPGTGVYTATVLAWFFGMNKWKAFLSVAFGLLLAGLIVSGAMGVLLMIF